MCYLLLLALAAPLVAGAGADYRQSLSAWRAERESRLKADDGWLTLAGLFWLEEGENVAGASDSAQIVLPDGSAPKRAGVFILKADRVTFRPEPGVPFTVDGRPAGTTVMRPDVSGQPTVLKLGALRLMVLRRGGKYAVRLKDNASPGRKNFAGLRWFPVDPSWRVSAKFIPYSSPRKVTIRTAAGTTDQMESPGVLEFIRAGKPCRLEPFLEGKELFIVFRDRTSGKSTYGAGRFLYAELPRNGSVTLDFNKAENPPCAFTPYATCPIAPQQNRLDIAIMAGEMKYPGAAGH